jgi:hypothetical protein
MPRSIVLALISFLVLSAGSKSAVAAETCPISPNPDAPSWCTLGIGGQFTAVVRQGEKTDTPLPVNYRICMAKPNELTTPEYATHVFYGISMNASSPLPQSATLHSGECFCAASTAGLQVASETADVVGGSMELLPSGSFSTNSLCKASDPTARPSKGVTLSRPRSVSAKCVSFYGGTPYHQERCEILNLAKSGNYRLCFPSDYSFPSGHTPAQFAGNAVKLFVNAPYMETNEGQYDARRSSITTTCMDVFDALTIQAIVFEPQPPYDPAYLPPPMHDPMNFSLYWKSDDVKRIKVLVQSIITR